MSTDSEPKENDDFALELEERTSVVHRASCPEIKGRLESNSPDIVYPFKTYTEAFKYGQNLKNRSYPKTCGKCAPWRSGSIEWHIHVLMLDQVSLSGVFNGCKSWLISLGAKIEEEIIDEFISAYYSPSGATVGTNMVQYPIIIRVKQVDDSVNVEMRTGYASTNLSYSASGAYDTPKIGALGMDLEAYLSAVNVEFEDDCSTSNMIRCAFDNLRHRRDPLTRHSRERQEVVEEPTEKRTLVTIVGLGLILIYAGFFFQFTNPFTENIIELVLTYGAAAGFIYWIYLSDKGEREPIPYIVLMFCWGIFSGLIAAPVNDYISGYIGDASTLTAAFVEEPIKAIGLYVFLTNRRFRDEFNSPVDGIIYGLAVGMGFYASENFVYYLFYDVGTLFTRILFCWGHGLWVAIVGLWIAVARHNRGYNTPLDMVPGLLVAMSLHFLWNGISYIGLMTGQIILYFALWQLNYLRRMVREGKGDEMLHGNNPLVFSNLKREEADKHSHSNKLLLVIVIVSLLSLQVYATDTIRGRSEDWTSMEFMHFSFQYPEKMDIETWSYNESEPDEFHGCLWLTYSRLDDFEGIYVEYAKTTDSTTYKSNYYNHTIGEDVELDEEATYYNGLHDIIYLNATSTVDGDKLYCVASAWYCLESNRVFYIEYYSTEQNRFTEWKTLVNSFECH